MSIHTIHTDYTYTTQSHLTHIHTRIHTHVHTNHSQPTGAKDWSVMQEVTFRLISQVLDNPFQRPNICAVPPGLYGEVKVCCRQNGSPGPITRRATAARVISLSKCREIKRQTSSPRERGRGSTLVARRHICLLIEMPGWGSSLKST